MTDLPYGRGGSPLQNLIVRGITETKISAIKVAQGIDSGDVYLKRSLKLNGTAESIFIKAASIIEKMIQEIVTDNITPTPQEGEIVLFKRRTPREGNLVSLKSIESVYDHIRMLDADNYPHAFLETDYLKFEFTRATLSGEIVSANVRISKK
jgi:methionyl-tRNA formyltransferase